MEAKWYGRARGQETQLWLPWRGNCRHQGSAWLGKDQVSRRAAWAFLIFLRRARRCAGVGFIASGTFGLGLARKRSPETCTGFDPRVSKTSRTPVVSGMSAPSSTCACCLLTSHA
jgi:hypothetical protein